MIELPPPTDESRDVARLKKQVTEVAKRYAKEYRWCNVVDSALAEMGIDNKNSGIGITVSGTAPFTAHLKVEPEELRDKTEQEQLEYLQDKLRELGPIRISMTNAWNSENTDVTPMRKAAELDTKQLEITEARNYSETGVPAPAGWEAAYTSNDGRVMHFVPEGTVGGDYRYASAMCGSSSYAWSFTSLMSEERVCTRCESRNRNRSQGALAA